VPDFAREDIALFAISYDAVDVLRTFADTYGITFPLLSDEGSTVMRVLGLLNEHVYEQHAAYGIPRHDRHWGVPYPGVLLLDTHGRVMQKRFQQSYRERETGVGLLEQGFGLQSTTRGAEVVTQSADLQVHASLDSPSYRFFQRLWLTVELTIAPGLHIYGRPIPAGYIPLTIEVAPLPGMVVGEPTWPAPQPYRVAGLAEEFCVYEGTITVSLPVTLTEEGGDQSLQITVHSQACNDRDCFVPQTLRLVLPVQAADHIERPRRQ
jgi:Disulphide bond corrector protein DsbC/AhpC/TSA family